MKHFVLIFALFSIGRIALGQQDAGSNFDLALPDHSGQISWKADGFKIVQSSAKPNGAEIGIRGRDNAGRLLFLGFLFLAPAGETLTSSSCRDEDLVQERKDIPSLNVQWTGDLNRGPGLPVAMLSYSTKSHDGLATYHVRGFVATGDACGDLEIYSSSPIHETDAEIAKIFASYQFNAKHTPTFGDVVRYAQILYTTNNSKAAAPAFEKALGMLKGDGSPFSSATIARRVVTDQAGMAYGMSGDLGKARSIFEKGIATDPDYPMYYYNLACADAGENKLPEAVSHLQAAFSRKADLIPGEKMPDPTADDSFLPYKGNREFWSQLENLQKSR